MLPRLDRISPFGAHLPTFQKEMDALVIRPPDSAAFSAVFSPSKEAFFLPVPFSLVVQPVALVKAQNCWYLLSSAFVYGLDQAVSTSRRLVVWNDSGSLLMGGGQTGPQRGRLRRETLFLPHSPASPPGWTWTVSRRSLSALVPVLGSRGRLARRCGRVWTAAVCRGHKSTFRPGQWRAESLGCVLPLCLSLCLSALCLLCWLSLSCHMLSVAEDTFTIPPPPSSLLPLAHETLNLSVMKHLSAFLKCEVDGDELVF